MTNQTEKKIRVAIADDQKLIRQGIGYVIGMQSDMTLVGEAGTGSEAVQVALQQRPDVVLMDVQMPEGSGIEAAREIVRALQGVKIIILTTFDVQEYVFEGIRAGAVGYLLKDADMQIMLETIRAVYSGEAVYRTGMAANALARVLSESDPVADDKPGNALELVEPLTEREQEVLQQMSYGLRNDQIAARLFISEGTVKTHIHRILQKLEVEDRTQAVVIALRNGLVK